MLSDLDGVVSMMDDVLVHGRTKEEHDSRLLKVLGVLQQNNVTLNKDKCQFGVQKVKFLGQLIDKGTVRADHGKIEAVKRLPPPKDVTELRRFLGMVNHLAKFVPNLATKTKPLRDLLSTKNQWLWEVQQQDAFEQIKDDLQYARKGY